MPQTKQQASLCKAYHGTQQQTRDLLQQITAWLDGHQECSADADLSMAHVLDVRSVKKSLENIMEEIRAL